MRVVCVSVVCADVRVVGATNIHRNNFSLQLRRRAMQKLRII